MAILELLVQITDNEQIVISLHANVTTRLWLDNDKNTNQGCLRACTMSTRLIRVFSRNAVWGWGEREIASVGRENVKNIQKQTKFVIVCVCVCVCVWGGGGGGGGDFLL